ncbi:galacturonokinase isoform X3 [Citrus sinensis]|uniref:galacturonokinase isoform X3 n=1 Tax=Citrus sinensis TaxID=2711 RepID=UPI002277EE46|nr:galacturonokinase isoform X3 [Citrus sinensis]
MGEFSWPTEDQLKEMRNKVSEMSGRDAEEVRVVVSPYRICPLGAHIDHQGGTVSAMTINKGILLGFVPSGDTEVVLRSGQFDGEVRFSDSAKIKEECKWGNYARGALYALQSRGNILTEGIIGYICGSDNLDSSGLSSSAAVGIAYLLALESANDMNVTPLDNIEYDRLIENGYLGLRNGILDQSAILLSRYGCLMCMDCKSKEYEIIQPREPQNGGETEFKKSYKILLAFSGLRCALTNNPGYNCRVAECQEAAKFLLCASGKAEMEPRLCNVEEEVYEAHKSELEPIIAKRAQHYFTENRRAAKGLKAWKSGNLEDFGKLISASGLSSIHNYECGSEPLIQLNEILQRAPGVFGARFSGAGFRGCCLALVDADRAEEAASYVRREYFELQPELASQLNADSAVLICEPGDSARVI